MRDNEFTRILDWPSETQRKRIEATCVDDRSHRAGGQSELPGHLAYRCAFANPTASSKSLHVAPILTNSSAQWAVNCRIVYDKFHVLQHANKAIDEVRRAEFFHKGGRMRGVIVALGDRLNFRDEKTLRV